MHRSLFAALALIASPLAAAPVEGPDSPQALIAEISDTIAQANHTGTVALLVEQREPARVIFDRRGEDIAVPASNNKLQVTATALHLLGPERTLVTRVVTNGSVSASGELGGDLIIIGAGDPSISGRFNGGNIVGTFEQWARDLQARGIRSIRGRIIGDDDLFDDDLIEETWAEGDLGEWYAAESSALSLNDNCVDIHWAGGGDLGEPALFSIDPVSPYMDIRSSVTTVAHGTDASRYYRRAAASRVVHATGSIPIGERNVDYASVHNPTLFFATVLRDTLIRCGIPVSGEAADIDDLDAAAVRQSLTELTSFTSPPLAQLIDVVNQHSQNFYADMLLRLIGVEAEGQGSFDAGARAVERYLAETGALPPSGWRMLDGSGLSRETRTTPRCLVNLLRHMDTTPEGPALRASLPRGRGERGSLRRRFGHSAQARAVAGQILGKTGYIGGVWALSGVITNQASVEFYYSIILNRYESQAVEPLRLIDSLAVPIAASTFSAEAPLGPAEAGQ